MDKLQNLESEITQIKERNKRVEVDKAWETSYFRRITIIIVTYLVIVIFFHFAKLGHPFLNAIVPTSAFVISTFSIPFFKKLWIKYFFKKGRI
jgi:hypothetical protein